MSLYDGFLTALKAISANGLRSFLTMLGLLIGVGSVIVLVSIGQGTQAGIKEELDPGDMLLYSGCDLEHWREEFRGNNCGQVFLHYNRKGSKLAKENEFDKRPFIGLPPWFKGFKSN